jgi:chaperone required for assembly of F1-ATPase
VTERDKGGKIPGKEDLAPPKLQRFYKEAGVETLPGPTPGQGRTLYRVTLDGRPVRTPRKQPLAVPYRALAEAIAAEWRAQRDVIEPATMPLTRFANSIIDGVIGREPEVRADILKYAGHDLVCYRAEGPVGLVQRQAAAWDPVIRWARRALAARLVLAAGVMPVVQPDSALEGIAAALEQLDAYRLTSIHVMTTLTGSALLALAHSQGELTADEAWEAAHVDEDWQIEQWGEDAEAAERRRRRWDEMKAASRLLGLVNLQ